MNIIGLKSKAKKMLEGHVWDILIPFLLTGLISSAIYWTCASFTDNKDTLSLISSLVVIALYPMQMGCIAYVLKFVRKEKYDLKLLFSYYNSFFYIFALYFLSALFISLWTLLFIIPGIVAALKYSMAEYIYLDGESDPMECIRKSSKMMEGYKWDYFKFLFSFFWWFVLIIITAGFATIYVGPYVSVARTLYYEELKKIS